MDLETLINRIGTLDQAAMQAARERQGTLTKPTGSLARLEDLSVQLAGITGQCPPPVPVRRAVIVFAGDHGVVAQGVSAYPQEVTEQMIYNFLQGGAAINVLSRQAGARVLVVDAGVIPNLEPRQGLIIGKIGPGTRDMTQGAAMTREEARAALELGAEVAAQEIERGLDLLACGEMGIGNSTPAAAITSALTGRSPRDVTGPGTGINSSALQQKIEIIGRALDINRPDAEDGMDVLSKVGGFEIGAIAGAMLAAASARVPVVVDGFITTAGALIAATLAPAARAYMIAGHRSAEPGHDVALAHLGLQPLLDLRMRLGEGTGAVLSMGLIEASALILRDMATFDSAGVSSH